MNRRQMLSLVAALAAVQAMRPASLAAQGARDGSDHPLWPLWRAWRDVHLDLSGRVVDGPQGRASHSEGQGYGMLLAAEVGDALSFERMLSWTEDNLAIRDDALLAWRWLPDAAVAVPDRNNASDGDLFFAWALVRAAAVFERDAYRERARRVAQDLAARCLIRNPGAPDQTILMPAANGFVQAGGVVVNLSYMMPLALRDVAAATQVPALAAAAEGGLRLMATLARTGSLPDWVRLTQDGPQRAPGFSFNIGYEALRLPLFLVWSGETGHPSLGPLRTIHERVAAPQAATIIDRQTGTVLETSADPGYRAITKLLACALAGGGLAPIPPFDPAQPYYPATLHLFCMLALHNAVTTCRPI